ncbi:hypothetical protein OSB04_020770 [Centaurea solstitialis]|uniref:Integrase catalytic domain-containing protein n=1 Tax=Centaurea solstitialis TaxID=347529 RepID=A0AA38W482_9ASTR|nr:hypothetical protein OSB04_020770 [Centaurea solstitialis]
MIREKRGVGTGKIRYPDLSTYHFAGTTKDLVDSLRNLEVNVRWPKKPENPSKDKDQTKWCDFHNDHGHNTDDCISLKKEIAYLKSNGHLKNLLEDSSKRPTSPVPAKVVNCITGGSDVCGLTYSAAKRHAREGPEGHPIPSESRSTDDKELDATKISFDIEDMSDAHQKHHDALVIQLTIGNCLTKRVLIDGGSSANVIFAETLKIMGIDRSSIVRRTTTLIGFNGDATNTLGEIVLPVFAKGINKQTKFNVIDCPSAYNAILGRPWIHDMKAVPSTYHQKIKFPSPWGVQEISQDGVRSYDDLQLEEVVLDHKHPDRKVFVGATLTPNIKNSIISFLQEHSDCFAWSHEDMVGIDPNIISHKLNVDPTFKPVKQKRRKFAPERNKVINEEVENLLKTGKIREVKYPDWLANVVVVQKKNGKWRVCIDFTDLNKACPKDPFPLPHIDTMVDATAGHELLTFMDAYSGYNQILMHKDDQEKTAFMTDKGIYCYKVMPFGLKNAGSTYQRLVNRMFKDHLGRTMEVYIDDMLVKSERSQDHIQHLKQSFDILREYISERTRKFCNERGIKLITSTPRYPQSNGLAESSNKTIINSIRKRLKAAKGRWVEELPSVLWANRTTPRTSTGQTPFSLVYGCEAVLPIESQVPVARHRTIEQNSIDLCYDIDALEELREKAFQKMASQKAMVERYFNKKVKIKVFQVGDHVLRRVFPNTQESNAGKLSIKWEGPYIITKIVGKGAYKISTIEGNEIPRSWNATHLKRYYF